MARLLQAEGGLPGMIVDRDRVRVGSAPGGCAAATYAPVVSVILPCYNEQDHIAAALTSLLRQDVALPYEVVVVDSSTDRSAGVVRDGFPSVVLVRRNGRLSCGAARNLGLRYARGSRILFTDADVRVPPDWVRLLAQGLEEADAVGGPIENGTPWSLTGTVNYYLEFCRLLPRRWRCTRRGWPFFAGANAGYRRDALNGVRFVSGLGEDVIVNHRLAAAGRTLRYSPVPVVRHVNKRGFRRVARYQYQLGIGGWRWRRCSETGSRWVMRWPVLMIGAPVLMLGHLLWHELRNLSWIGFAKILILSPVLVLFHSFWVAGFIAGERALTQEHSSGRERSPQVLRAHGEAVAGGEEAVASPPLA